VSGNVSLYNETNGAAIPPTPVVGAVGLIGEGERHADFSSMRAGDSLLLIGETRGELGASLYLRDILVREDGAPPRVDLVAERRNGDFVRRLIGSDLARCVHDLSDCGLIAAAAEMAMASGIGLELSLPHGALSHAFLFGEDQARYLLTTVDPEAVLAAAKAADVPATRVGRAGGDAFAAAALFSIPLAKLRAAHEAWLPAYMA
jgi:phosphoribosylformylglycinamidine synthase subunit PurL